MSGLVVGIAIFLAGCVVTYGLIQSLGGGKAGQAHHGHGGGHAHH